MNFHLDTYDSTSAHCFNFTNLSLLLDCTEKADRLRKFVIERHPPSFSKAIQKSVADTIMPVLKTLNKVQQKAVLMALTCNDYLLIRGMPGTGIFENCFTIKHSFGNLFLPGKTATIVAIIRILFTLNQTVLITSHTHSAVDNVCIKLKKHGINVLRLGSEGKIHPSLHEMSEYARIKNCSTAKDLEAAYLSAVSIV